jgi:hypothetical protein
MRQRILTALGERSWLASAHPENYRSFVAAMAALTAKM